MLDRFKQFLENVSGRSVSMFGTTATPPRRGSRELLEAYTTMPWLRATVSKTARGVANTQWMILAQRGADGRAIRNRKAQLGNLETRKAFRKQEEVEEVFDNPMLDVLMAGNRFIPGTMNLELAQIYLDIVGESYMLKERNGAGVPIALWPLPPTWIKAKPVPGGDEMFKISHGTLQADIASSEIIHFTDPNPVDPYGRGSGMGMTLGDELETDEFAAKHTNSFFRNKAIPHFIVSLDGAKEAEAQAVEDKWTEKYGGFWQQFKPMITNRSMEIQQLSQNLGDMGFTELREFERNTIHQVFGLPPEKLGIVENSNRATIESSDFMFNKDVVLPRVEAMRSFLQMQLAPDFDERIILDFESPVKEDKEHKLNVMKAAPWSFRVDEWREAADEQPLDNDEGQVFMLPLNLIPQGTIGGTAPVTPAPEGRGADPAKKHLTKQDEEQPVPQSAANFATVLDQDQIKTAVWGPVAAELERLMIEIGEDELQRIGSDLAFERTERVEDFIGDFTTNRSKIIDDTTKGQIAASLREGFEAGEDVEQLTERLQDLFEDQIPEGRLSAIARTESVRAINFGSVESMRQANVGNKQWVATADDAVRDAHERLDGEVVARDGEFEFSGARAQYPGDFGVPELDINCRCTVIADVVDRPEFRSTTAEQRKRIWKAREAEREPAERTLKRLIRRGLEVQRDAVITRLQERA